jgi:hypothetical protein
MREGKNPYEMIGPTRTVFWNFRLLYPAPALVIAYPFTIMPLVPARALFVGLTSGALAFVLTRRSWSPLAVFTSASWWFAVGIAQWSPLMLAATMVPSLGFVIAAKPNIGLAVLASAPTRRAVIIASACALAATLLAFALWPRWLPSWLDAIGDTPHVRPIVTMPGGFLLLLAAVKWRRPEARLLLTLALVPMNPGLYEGVLLFAVPRSFVEGLVLALLSWCVDPLSVVPTGSSAVEFFGAIGRAMFLCMYLPALVMVLRRPNECTVPAFRRLPVH